MGGRASKHTVEYRTDPALVEALNSAQAANSTTLKQMETMQSQFTQKIRVLQDEKSAFMQELGKMKAEAEKPKKEYNEIVKLANEVIASAT